MVGGVLKEMEANLVLIGTGLVSFAFRVALRASSCLYSDEAFPMLTVCDVEIQGSTRALIATR